MVNPFLGMFQQFKTILCICPKCNSLSRLSDLHLRAKGKAPKTWLDSYQFNSQKVDEQEEKFNEKEEKIREKARERGRAQVPILVRKSMDTQFAKLRYDPYDIKPLLHPVDFAVFDGLNNGALDKIILLSRKNSNNHLNILQRAVAKTVEKKQFDWKMVRISIDGQITYE